MYGNHIFTDNQNMMNPVMGDTMLYDDSGKRRYIAQF